MARWRSKEMVLNVSTTNEAILFLEALQKQIKIVDIIADYFPGKVNIRFEGSKDNLKEALDLAKKMHQNICGMLYPDSNDFYVYDIEFLSKTTGKTFPVVPLLQILDIKGFESTRKNGSIIAKIDYKSLIKTITILDKTLNEIPYEVATSSLRDVIITIAVAKDMTAESAVEIAKKAKIVTKDELDRLNLVVEPKQAIEKCLKIAK